MNRKSLVVFGSIGSVLYLSWLTWTIFYDSWAFPFVLTALGIFVIFLGVQLQKYISGGTLAPPPPDHLLVMLMRATSCR